MKKVFAVILLATLTLNCLTLIGYAENISNSQKISIDYQESYDVIIGNPGKGYERYGDASVSTSDKVLEYASIGYWRFPWFMLEPKEGEYNWKPIDDFLEKWDERGGRCAFGVMAVASSSSNYSEYITPKWVFDAGAKSLYITYTDGRKQYIPETWSDPVLMEKVSNFAKALAERYDGDRRIAYIDIRTCGNWGETHIMEMPAGTPAITYEDIKSHIDAWSGHFSETQLMLNTANWSYEKEKIEYAVSKGVGLRYDGVQARPFTQYRLVPSIGKEPNAWEFWNPYANIKKQNPRNFKGWSAERYLHQFLIGKPSYADLGQYNTDPDQMIADEEDLVKLMANKMGYHFTLTDMEISDSFAENEVFDVSFFWKNSGVNQLYESCYTFLAVLDENNKVVAKCRLEGSNPRGWQSNETTVENLKASFTNLTGESYKLAVGLLYDVSDETPSYKIGNFNMTEDKWYLLADINRNNSDGRYYVKAFPKVKVCGNIVDNMFYSANGKRYVDYEKVLKVFGLMPYTEPLKSGTVEFGYEADTVVIDCANNTVKVNDALVNVASPYYVADDRYYVSDEIFGLVGDLKVTYNSENNCIMIDSEKDLISKQSMGIGKIVDGGFENYFDVWSYSNESFKLSDESKSEGKFSLYHSADAKTGSAYQTFEIEYDTYYKLSFDAKGTVSYSLKDMSAIMINDEIQTEQGLYSEDWKTYTTTLGLDKNVLREEKGFVQLSFNTADGQKEVYIDNVRLEKLGKFVQFHKENEMFQEGGFETTRHGVLAMNELAYFERSRNNPHSGEFCGRIYDRREQWSGAVIAYTEEFWKAGPGKYKFEGWFRTSEGESEMTAYINYANNNVLPGWSYTFNIGSEWTYISTEVEVDEQTYNGIATAELFLLGDSNAANNKMDIYIDDISLTYIGG